MIKKVIAALGVVSVLTLTAYGVDDYYGDKTLDWYEDVCNSDYGKTAISFEESFEPVPCDCLFYLLGWRLIDNYFPTVSEFLAPAPKLNRVEAVDNVQKQDYYYDSWAGRTIMIDAEVRE